MESNVTSISGTISDKTIGILFDLSKANIEQINVWFSWMLAIAGIILTVITILLGLIAYLTWTHIKQAKRASEVLEDAERKRIQETGGFIAASAVKQAAMKQRTTRQKTGLLRSEVADRAYKHRGFSPILFQAVGESPVFAIDEYGYKHWIPNPPTLIRMGYSWSDVKHISKDELDKIQTGENIPDLSK